jgi:hypothetical protein
MENKMPCRAWCPAMIGAALCLASSRAAVAQTDAPYDPEQLPAFHGKVACYDLDRRGDVDGLILEAGTEVHVSARLATRLAALVRPGDAITVHGLKARKLDLVQAMSVSQDASSAAVVDNGIDPGQDDAEGQPAADRSMDGGKLTDVRGTIRLQLHDTRGNLDGVLLADGTIVHLPPRAAAGLAAELAPGQPFFASGAGRTSLLGRVVDARAAGPSADQTTPLQGSP